MSTNGVIALISDFGLRDPYVGVMKGVVLGINPKATLVDLSHGIEPGDILCAAYALRMSVVHFPEGTTFLAVVDPGVGMSRRGIAIKAGGRYFVGPDNGVFSRALEMLPLEEAVELTNPKYCLKDVSNTFHGRDVFAPVAAHISSGIPLSELGEPVFDITRLAPVEMESTPKLLRGEVVYIDRFGNMLTNIGNEEFRAWRESLQDGTVKITFGSTEITDVVNTYGVAPSGHPVVVFGGEGVLEISINGRSAADALTAIIGTKITIYHIT